MLSLGTSQLCQLRKRYDFPAAAARLVWHSSVSNLRWRGYGYRLITYTTPT
jgi:hypothetical protein